MNSSPQFVNVSAYKFVRLSDLSGRRQALRLFCREQGLKGTILLSPEGINLFVAGPRDASDALLRHLRSQPELHDLQAKESLSDRQPFRRMLVKIKPEIITFDVPGVDPVENPARKISAGELKQWLDEARPVTLLDVRNDYEVQLGTFRNALPVGVQHFRQFPAAVDQLPDHLRQQPIVMFCTGGIRCEKAAPFLLQKGFQDVWQLDGGILKYFEEVGGEYFDGECFVFDQRVALDSHLQETETTLCFACQATLTTEDQKSPKYMPGESCPACYRTETEQMSATIARRQAALLRVSSPLPGSRPYDNRRPLNIPARFDQSTLLECLAEMHPHVTRREWQAACDAGHLLRDNAPLQTHDVVRAGERIERVFPGTIEPEVDPRIQILYEDEMLVVVNKPAPLPMHPCGQFNRNTLLYLLQQLYRPQQLRVAHRLDANTTGVVVLSRTRNVAARVQPQFEAGQVRKQYLARVRGLPQWQSTVCTAPISPQPNQSGARRTADDGQAARTEFELLERFADETALLLVRPLTGRTNQIRLHLAHVGYPICGDPLYQGGDQIGDRQTLSLGDPPLCLHAWRIELSHPATEQPITFQAPRPAWALPE